MNFLAHAFLSFNNPQVLTGNLISDFVKGNARYSYRPGIQKGISLHRDIDRITDSHPEISAAKNIFRPAYGLYSAAITDVCMDFFLANDKTRFASQSSLLSFSLNCYSQVSPYINECPEKFRNSFSKMQEYNWLYNYQFEWAIERSLAGLVKRSKYMTNHQPAFRLFTDNLAILQRHYENFFPYLQHEAQQLFHDAIET